MKFARIAQRPVAAGTLVAAVLLAAPIAAATSGDFLREGLRNGTATNETEIIGKIDARPGKGGYVTRQSNIQTGSKAGGAAIYGCRTPAGGTSVGSAPCLRASNLAGGFAFEFASTGTQGGLISLGDPTKPNSGSPFITNASGVATGLNADKVDGKDASELVGATGPTGPTGATGPRGPSDVRVAVDANESVATCASTSISGCPNLLTRTLTAGNWLVQAKLTIDNNGGAASSTSNRCGLANGTTVLDEARNSLGANVAVSQNEAVALMAVMSGVADGTTVAVRCTEQGGENLQVEDVKLTALQVETVTGP